jgi:hypothetical protein
MASNTLSIDPRIVSTLIPSQNGDDLASAAIDILDRVAATLELFSGLIGAHSGEIDPLGSDDKRFAFSLQLDSMASLLRATSDALGARHDSDKEGGK